MGRKLTTSQFIDKSLLVHKDEYDYSLINYVNSKTKVKIICKKHGVFEQLPINHIYGKGCGCPICYGNIKLSTSEFIKKAKLIHSETYDYSVVQYLTDKLKVKIICKKHGVFEQTPNSHLEGHGCFLCSSRKMDHNIFLEKCENKYNNLYDYSLVKFTTKQENVKIICKIHGEVSLSPMSFLNRVKGCAYCSMNSYKDIENFRLIANKIHQEKYTYHIIDNLDKSSYINIVCKIHGEFQQRIDSHINGKCGCRKCANDNRRKDKKELLDQFCITHGDYYDYSLVKYYNNQTKIEIICKKHGIFKQGPKRHIEGDGCPSCNLSKGELMVSNFLKRNNIRFQIEKIFEDCLSIKSRKLRFDFYLPDYNIIIEYDGIQHFESINLFGGDKYLKKVQENDNIKNKYCQYNNIKLIRIPYTEYSIIDNILSNEIK